MNRVAIKSLKGLVLILVFLTTALAGTSWAATFDLQAGVLMKTMPDGRVVPMWGFGPVGGTITVPGPPLIVTPGDDALTINLTNNLPVPVSVIVPGLPKGTVTPQGGVQTDAVPTWTDGATGARTSTTQRVRSLTLETPPGATWTYSWSIANPGSYLYKSGTHQQVQVGMGLYGAVKKDFASGQAYNVVAAVYANEIFLFFSEIDPVLNDAVANGSYGTSPSPTSAIGHSAKYFLINGEPFSYRSSVIPAGTPGQRTLLRFLNAGYQDYVPILQGVFMNVLAEDSHLYPFPKNQYSLQLSPGRTMDAIIINPAAGYIPLYDRRLHLTNAAASPGGMLTYLNIAPPGAPLTLTANTAGTGSGKVQAISLPAGIDCNSANPGADPAGCTEPYNPGTVIALAAQAASGSEFTGWSGALTGTVSPSPVTMDADKAVTATFNLLPSITLTSPNGGESWARGTTQTIAWSFTADPGPNVSIQLISERHTGTSVIRRIRTIAASVPIGAGSFNWKIPRVQPVVPNYKVRITSTTNPAFTDISEGFFTIAPIVQ